ncbi:hypothetical protein ACOJR9_06480 [Alteromonas sp. A081]
MSVRNARVRILKKIVDFLYRHADLDGYKAKRPHLIHSPLMSK